MSPSEPREGRVIFVVNDLARTTADQTTALLLAGAAARWSEVAVANVDAFSLEPDGRVSVQARAVVAQPHVSELLRLARATELRTLSLTAGDALLIRTNPAREPHRAWAHAVFLDLARVAQDHGVLVLNDPVGLSRAQSKLYLSAVPEWCRPPTLVSRDPARLRRFLAEAPGKVVLKPLQGTRGQDVFCVDPAAPRNLSQILDVLTRSGFAMAQHFVPEAIQGDLRVVLLEGRVLTAGDREATVRRVPPADDFRSNVAIGGTPQRATLEPDQRRAAEAIGDQLRADGIFLAGLDLIGAVAVEVNVFSTGGLGDAGVFEGVDFIAPVLDAVERLRRSRLISRPPPPSLPPPGG